MKILICNWADSPVVKKALEEINANAEEYEITEEEVSQLFTYFAFTKQLSVKVIHHREPIGMVMVVDDEKFRKRNPKSHYKRTKKEVVQTKEYGDKRYSVDEILPFVDKRTGIKPIRKDFDGDMIKMNSLRLRTFKEKGCTCVQCGIEGTYFLKVRGKPNEGWHFNLYGDKEVETEEGTEIQRVLFTKDHIQPKSKGGPDSLANMQTMCERCNSKKGNKTDG